MPSARIKVKAARKLSNGSAANLPTGSGSNAPISDSSGANLPAGSGNTDSTFTVTHETMLMDQICLTESKPPSKPKTKAVKIKVGDLDKALKAQGIGPQKVGDKEAKINLLKSLAEREENHPMDIGFYCGNLEEELEQERVIFKQPPELWQGIADLKPKDVPKQFDIETVTKFLTESKINVTINGEAIDVSTVKPVVSGRQMYHSHKVIDCKFMFTTSLGSMITADGNYFLLISVMDSSMGKDRRYVAIS